MYIRGDGFFHSFFSFSRAPADGRLDTITLVFERTVRLEIVVMIRAVLFTADVIYAFIELLSLVRIICTSRLPF